MFDKATNNSLLFSKIKRKHMPKDLFARLRALKVYGNAGERIKSERAE